MSDRKFLLTLASLLTLIFAILQIAAQFFSFYWTYWWFDWLMHFLAGLTGGLVVFWVLYYSWFWRRWTDRILLPALTVLVCLLIVGVVWEIAEYAFNITDRHEVDYADDIRNDLIADSVGAMLAALISIRTTFRREITNV